MTRAEHLQWAKGRALQYSGHIFIEVGVKMIMSGTLKTTDDMRRFIEGFN